LIPGNIGDDSILIEHLSITTITGFAAIEESIFERRFMKYPRLIK